MNAEKRCNQPGTVLFVAILSLLLTGASSDSTYEEICERGRREIAENQIEKAIATFTQAIELNPQDSSSYFNRASANREKKDYPGVIADCTKAIELAPKNALYYAERAAVYYEMNNLDKAAEDFTKALDYNKRDPLIYLGRAKVFFAQKDFDAAKTNYERSIEYDDQNVHAWIGLARSCYEKGLLAKALDAYDQAIRLDPKCASHHYWKAVIYYDQRDFESVITETEKALSKDPELVPAIGLHGIAQHYLKKDPQALADFDRAIQSSKVDPGTFLWRGRINYDAGDYQKAIDDFTDAIDLDDQYASAFRERAKAHEKLAGQENLPEKKQKQALEAAEKDRATAKKLESQAQVAEESQRESRFFLTRSRARLPGLKDRRLKSTASLPEKQRPAGDVMASEARLRAEQEQEPIKELAETITKIEAIDVVPQLTESAEKTLQDAKKAFDRGSYEIAALGFRSVKSQSKKIFAEYDTAVSRQPDLWSRWATKHAEANTTDKPWTVWAALAACSYRFDNREDYTKYMQKAQETIESEVLTNPGAGLRGWTSLSDVQAECEDIEGAKASVKAAAGCCEGLSRAGTVGNAYAACAGYSARYGDTAGWSRYYQLAQQKAQQVGNTYSAVRKRQPVYTSCLAHALAWDPEKALSCVRDMEQQNAKEQPYLMADWLADMYALSCLATAHRLPANRSPSEMFEKSYAAACANLASFLDPQYAAACVVRRRLVQADAIVGACDRAWIGALGIPDPTDRAFCLNLILRRYVETGHFAEALEAYERLPAEWKSSCALPWIGEAEARLGRKSMQELKLWTIQSFSPIEQALVLYGIAVGVKARDSSPLDSSPKPVEPTSPAPLLETEISLANAKQAADRGDHAKAMAILDVLGKKSPPDSEFCQVFDRSAAANPAWWLDKATQSIKDCGSLKTQTAFWTRLAELHHQNQDHSARDRAIAEGRKCIVDFWTKNALGHPSPRRDYAGNYRRADDFRSKSRDLADISAILESLLEWEELQYRFGDRDGAFNTFLMALKSVEMLPRDSSHTLVAPNSFSAWMATLAGRARRHGRSDISDAILSRCPWSKAQGLVGADKAIKARAALEADDLAGLGDYVGSVQQSASRSGDVYVTNQAAEAAALLAQSAARQGDTERFRQASLIVGGLVNDRRAPASRSVFRKLAIAAIILDDLNAAETYIERSGVKGPERDLMLAMLVEKMIAKKQNAEAEKIAAELCDETACFRAIYAVARSDAAESSRNLSKIWERIGPKTHPAEKAAVCAGVAASLLNKNPQ